MGWQQVQDRLLGGGDMVSKNNTMTIYIPVDKRHLIDWLDEKAAKQRRAISFIVVEELERAYQESL